YGATSVHVFLCNWYKVASDRYSGIFADAGDHAGDLETSLMLAHFPELVHLERADDGHTPPCRFEAVRQGWVEMTRPWHLLTTNSGAGNPKPATAEKGREITDIVVARLAQFL